CRSPQIDQLVLGSADVVLAGMVCQYGHDLTVHDLRPMAVAARMVREWRRRLPWRYYRDLWMEERGQWLATYLRLGKLRHHRPSLRLDDVDRAPSLEFRSPYVALAPHVGGYGIPGLGALWT